MPFIAKSKQQNQTLSNSLVGNVIRLLQIFVFCSFSHISFSQNEIISVDFQNKKIENAIIELAATHGYEIVFNSSYFGDKTISLQATNQSFSLILQKILEDTKVDVAIKGKKIILTKRRKLYGYIIDKKTGETLINATVYDPQSGIGAVSNDFGFFTIEIPFENKFLIPSYIGYESDKIRIDKIQSFPFTIELETNSRFGEIIVTKDEATIAVEKDLGKTNLITNDIKTLYATGGEPDVFQYLYTQTGITTGPDGLGGVHVRGGDVSHNLFLYDGVKVYTPFHSLGLFSIFDVNQLKHAEFSKYGFHPKHGGRLSSVLEMDVKEGSLHQWNANASFSTLASHFGVDGPIVKGKTSISLYGRRTHLDPWVKNKTEEKKKRNSETGYSNHFFFDLNAKLQHQLSQKDKLSLTLYGGRDAYQDKTNFYFYDPYNYYYGYYDDFEISDTIRYHLKWQNQLAALKWNHLYNDKLFSNLTLSYTDFKYQSTYQRNYIENQFGTTNISQFSMFHFFSNINDVGVELDFDFFPNPNHHISFGGGFHRINYRPGVGQDSLDQFFIEDFDDPSLQFFNDSLSNSYRSQAFHFYANDQWRLLKNLHLKAGIRYSNFQASNLIFGSDSRFHIFQSSISLRWSMLKNLSATVALDRTEQPLHLLSTSNIGFPNDLWLPSIDNIEPEEAHQINLGLNFHPHKNLNIAMNGYLKKMDNLLKFSEQSSIPSLFDFFSDFWESEVTTGEGISKGIELDVDFQTKKFKSSIAYTFSKADRTFKGFNGGKTFPFEFDQRHKLTLNFYQKILRNLWWYANWNFSNGIRQTLYESSEPYTPIDNYIPPPDTRLTSINGDQLPNYHRLDLGIIWRISKTRWNHELQLGVQNVYDRENIYFTYERKDDFFPGQNGRKKSTSLPILPSVMYKVSFSGKGK